MAQTILVPTDFSNNATAATRYAIWLARKLRHNVHILHAYLPFTSAFQSPNANETEEQRARLGAEKSMATFLAGFEDMNGVQISHSLVKNTLVAAVEEYVERNPTAILIMGTHGASGTRRDILGSNTYDVSKSVSVPLLVVPDQPVRFDIGHVAFFTDYHKDDVQSLNDIKAVFGDALEKCTLVHVVGEGVVPTEADTQKLEDWKSSLAQQTGFERLDAQLIQGKENVEVVEETVDRLQADLTLLTLVGGRNFLENLLHKSMAKTIIISPKTPVFLSAKKMD
ncbi:universal stress protein [Parapedobacter deserti]|uniref:Universal stress protein n=1 Tax=Parapedobacter deserti TaxID=1912957 RepID=A0ABV7JF93_9SPHI